MNNSNHVASRKENTSLINSSHQVTVSWATEWTLDTPNYDEYGKTGTGTSTGNSVTGLEILIL